MLGQGYVATRWEEADVPTTLSLGPRGMPHGLSGGTKFTFKELNHGLGGSVLTDRLDRVDRN